MKHSRKAVIWLGACFWLCAAVIPVGAARKGENAVIAAGFSQETEEQKEDPATADENETGGSAAETGDGDSGEEGKNQSDLAETGSREGSLLVDDLHIYRDMKRSYQEGYEPEIKDGKATLILPLYTDGSQSVDSVQAVLDLGSTENSPFVYRNYKKTFAMTEETVEGSAEKMRVFLVRFDLELQEQRLNGVYPVTVDVSYKMDGSACTQSFTIYVQISDGKSGEEETEQSVAVENAGASETEEIPTSEPRVLIDSCKEMPEQIFSGDTVAVRVVLRNTNAKKYVQNMTVTVSSETEALSLLSDSDTCYFEKLEAEGTLEIPLSFTVSESAEAGDYFISFEMSYDNPDAETLTSSGKVRIHVLQRTELVLEIGDYASEVQAGDSISIPLQAMNLGRGAVYNVRCQMDVPGLTADKSLFLGNLEGGSASSGNLEAFAGMVQADAETDEERYGRTDGYITVTYEDESGNAYTQEEKFSITINPLVIQTAQEEEGTSVGIQLLVGFAVLLLAAGLGVLVPWLIRKRKMEKTHE